MLGCNDVGHFRIVAIKNLKEKQQWFLTNVIGVKTTGFDILYFILCLYTSKELRYDFTILFVSLLSAVNNYEVNFVQYYIYTVLIAAMI